MKQLNTLLSKILGKATAATATPPSAAATAPAETAAPETAAAGAPAPIPTPEPVDIQAVLTDLAAKHPEKLDWKKSIVDLMKLVGMDSSFAARKDLAQELGYTGDSADSAKMNIWLHKQVLQKLAENGGQVPEALLR